MTQGPDVVIVEEVPGLPPAEAFYVRLNGETHRFPDVASAETFCKERGLTYRIEWSEP